MKGRPRLSTRRRKMVNITLDPDIYDACKVLDIPLSTLINKLLHEYLVLISYNSSCL